MISLHILLITLLHNPGLIFGTQLNVFKYCNLIRIIQFTIDYFLHTDGFKYFHVTITT